MYKSLVLALSFIFLMQCFTVEANPSTNNPATDYLLGKIPVNNKRYKTMKLALELMNLHQPKVIVETGTARYGSAVIGFTGDGSATLIFGKWAQRNDSVLYSVDISPEAIATSRKALGNNYNVQLVCHDSVSFLHQFLGIIDFLYLDSLDYDFTNPFPSQEHHLNEIIAAYPKLASNCVIMIDDCDLPGGGKGALVVPYLLERGWKIIANDYQIILMK